MKSIFLKPCLAVLAVLSITNACLDKDESFFEAPEPDFVGTKYIATNKTSQAVESDYDKVNFDRVDFDNTMGLVTRNLADQSLTLQPGYTYEIKAGFQRFLVNKFMGEDAYMGVSFISLVPEITKIGGTAYIYSSSPSGATLRTFIKVVSNNYKVAVAGVYRSADTSGFIPSAEAYVEIMVAVKN